MRYSLKFHLKCTGWRTSTGLIVELLAQLTEHSTSNKRSLTEQIICYLPIIFWPVLTFCEIFFLTYYPNIPIILTSLLTPDQHGELLYMVPIYLCQFLIFFLLTFIGHIALYIALSFIVTMQQNCDEELKNLQR